MKLRAGEKRGMGVLWFFSMLWLDGYRKIRPQYWHHTGSLLVQFSHFAGKPMDIVFTFW